MSYVDFLLDFIFNSNTPSNFQSIQNQNSIDILPNDSNETNIENEMGNTNINNQENTNNNVTRGNAFMFEQRDSYVFVVHTSVFSLNNEDDINLFELFGGNDTNPTPASEEKINQLELHTIDEKDLESDRYKKECSICLNDYELNETIKILECSHFFHSECIDQWFKYGNTCPYCKKEI